MAGPCHEPGHQLLRGASGTTRPPAPRPVSGLAHKAGEGPGKLGVWWSWEAAGHERKRKEEWSGRKTPGLMGGGCRKCEADWGGSSAWQGPGV